MAWTLKLSFFSENISNNLLNCYISFWPKQQDLCEVLDAMFERKVTPGELVIKQGDDGDYFYVIEE